MRAETFIAQRLFFAKQGKERASRPAVKVALAGIVVGVVVMILTFCIVVGFKQTITSKMAGFGAHIQVTNFEDNRTHELSPITVTDSLIAALGELPHVKTVQPFLTKPGVVKTKDSFQGVVVKGTNYWTYFSDNLLRGRLPEQPNEILLSENLSRSLQLDVDSGVYCYFVGEDLRVRKLHVTGVYRTGFKEYDELFVLAPMPLIRQLNQWSDSLVSGLEILVDDFSYLDDAADAVYYATVNRMQENGEVLYTQTLQQLNPQIFSWLDLLDMNVVVIIILMLCVSGFNIISGLIILILDSIQLIGTLKALGASNRFVRRIFVTQSTMLVGQGMIWGNVIGLGLAAVQYITHLLPLDAASYYVDYVPVAFPWLALVALNIGVVVVSVLILLAPSAIITRISPAKVMHFD